MTDYDGMTDSFTEDHPAFGVALWLGQHRAFGLVGNHASAGDAYTLSHIRTYRLYRHLGLTWETFCSRHLAISHKTADALIARLKEFGDTFFELSEIVRIPVRTYRVLKSAITADGVLYDGELIPITRENTARLVDAIYHLRIQLGDQQRKNLQLRDSAPFTRFEVRIDRCLGEVSGKLRRGLDDSSREQLIAMLDSITTRIQHLRRSAQQKA